MSRSCRQQATHALLGLPADECVHELHDIQVSTHNLPMAPVFPVDSITHNHNLEAAGRHRGSRDVVQTAGMPWVMMP